MPSSVKCPTCSKPVEWTTTNSFRPFCCERCKLIDLGEWASGERHIAGAPLNENDLANIDDVDTLRQLLDAEEMPRYTRH